MQAVFVCGGAGTRLRPRPAGPKSLVSVGGAMLLARLIDRLGPLHRSLRPPVVIVDASDGETPGAVRDLLPSAQLVRQTRPDGVANALLLARPCLDDAVLVALGDLFLEGEFAAIPSGAAIAIWRGAPASETTKNFGVTIDGGGRVTNVVEKPEAAALFDCGVGVYALTRAAISCFENAPVDARGERGITGAIQTAIDAGITFRTFSFSGYYNNVNSLDDLAAVEGFLGSTVA
jgi:dTDP-glucose pyrophosphorylase